MPDNTNAAMINSVKETIKSSTIWNKLVKTIENANINMEKLIQDSVTYGIEIGMFQQNKEGIIECKDAKRLSNSPSNEKFVSPLQQKNLRNEDTPQICLRSAPRSDSETTLSAYSAKSIVTRTKKQNSEKDLKRSSEETSETNSKRLKSDTQPNSNVQNFKTKPFEQKPTKFCKAKPINRKMVRPIPICAFCLGDEALNKRTKRQENMISCWDCGTCAHPTCLQWPDSLYQKVRTIRWQCLQCKRCSYCGMISRKDDDMLLCDACDQGFHIYCCDPPIKVPPKGEWVCRICRPTGSRKEKPSIFSPDDYEFSADCQIITPESVRKICNISPKPPNNNISKSIKNKIKVKSRLPKKSIKVNLLHLKKKKLVNKAVQRQRQALTDGLSKFFTPSNKRQSRVSKQSISSESLFDKESKRSNSFTSPIKDKSCNRSVVSSSRSKSPIPVDVVDDSTNSDVAKSHIEKKRNSNKKLPSISIYRSPKRISQDSDIKLHSNIKANFKRLKLKKLKLSKKSADGELIINRGRGRPKKVIVNDKVSSVVENSASITESSSITMSKNDLSTNYSVLSTEVCETDPCPISDIDRQWYSEIQQKVVELLPPPVDAAPQLLPPKQINTPSRVRNEHADPPELSIENHIPEGDHCNINNTDSSANQRYPPRIQIGRYIIDTWYSAPYPSEYARLNVLYICEYCLKPIKSYDVYVMHMEKCTFYFPPGNEIYRNGDLSVFEVDGYVSKLYCQQLCLLAKLFLDHKTLYYDVEPFLFYVAVLSKNKSSHIIGYFSKEKRSTHKYNLSCIMVLPPHQKYNYGRFLIDFSYLLSRKEGQCGSPEKPLSTLGRISYESYWKSKILPFILNKDDVTVDFYARQKIYKPSKGLAVTIDRVSTETGISPHDVASTIQLLSKKVDLDNSDRISIQFDWEKLKSEAEKYASRYPKWIPIDEECLRWVPLINPNEKGLSIVRSPTQSVHSPKDYLLSPETDKNKLKKSANEVNKTQNATKTPMQPEKDNGITTTTTEAIPDLPKIIKKKRESLTTTHKSIQSMPKSKIVNKSKSTIIDKGDKLIVLNKNVRKKEIVIKRDLIVTRNRSNNQNNNISTHNEKESPINVDLTKESSENSDIQDNDELIEISSSIPKKRDIWTNKKPVFEIFKETIIPQVTGLKLSPPKESPPINRNDPSPVSMVNNEIGGPVLVSPEIDEENEEESDLGPIINDKRRLILILEKCDGKTISKESQCKDTIDLSDDGDIICEKNCGILENLEKKNVFKEIEGKVDKSMEVVISRDSPSLSNPITLSNSNDSFESANYESYSEVSKIDDFVLPATVKDTIDDCDKPPTLKRISSQDYNTSNHLDDSSTSFNLPADISQNEEFKNFYNDGNVFNSITTSQATTDSSDKDVDDSLLSVSNSNSFGISSDVELNTGTYSCDSSICYNLRPRVRSLKLEEEFFDNNALRCSPGQSDLVHNHVSSTTPFVSPSPIPTNDKLRNEASVDLNNSDEITFEDVGCTNNEIIIVDINERCCSESSDKSHHRISPGRKFETINNKDIENKKVDPKKEVDNMKSDDLNKVNIDVVSSSLNETSTISDSSL